MNLFSEFPRQHPHRWPMRWLRIMPCKGRSTSTRSRPNRRAMPHMAMSRPMRRWFWPSRLASRRAVLAEAIAAKLAQAHGCRPCRYRWPRLHQPPAPARRSGRRLLDAALAHGEAYGGSRPGRRAQGQCRVCLGQSDGATACRPLPWCRLWRCAGAVADETGYDVTREYYINDAGAQVDTSRARPFCATARRWARTSAKSRRALSGRLPEAGGRGTGEGAW